MAQTAGLGSLPPELIIDTFINLPPLDILHCRQTCSKLRDIIDASNNLKIVIDMYEHGYLLVYPIRRPLIDIWDNFIKNYRLLTKGDRTHARRMVPRDHVAAHDGVLLRFYYSARLKDHGSDDEHPAGCLMLCDMTNPTSKWEIDLSFDVNPITCCAVSVVSRLLAITESTASNGTNKVKVHLFDLYLGTPHLDAHSPLEFCNANTGEYGATSVLTGIYGDIVGLLTGDRRVMVWNWKLGSILLDIEAVISYAFLSDAYLLIIPAGTEVPSFAVISILTGHRQVLELPFAKSPGHVDLNAASVRYPWIRSSPPGISGSRGEYTLDRSLDVIVFNFGSFEFNVVISCGKLLRKLLILGKHKPESGTVSWRDWGPETTRWISRQRHLWTLRRPTAGPIFSYMVDDPLLGLAPATKPIRRRFIMDFNHRPIVRKDQMLVNDGPGTVMDKWVVSSSYFSEDVECHLPFRTMATHDIKDDKYGSFAEHDIFMYLSDSDLPRRHSEADTTESDD